MTTAKADVTATRADNTGLWLPHWGYRRGGDLVENSSA